MEDILLGGGHMPAALGPQWGWDRPGPYPARSYQRLGCELAWQKLERHRSTLLVYGTGTGKTLMYGNFCAAWPRDRGRILILQDRDELIEQTVKKVGVICGESVEVEQGKLKAVCRQTAEIWGLKPARIIVASKDTLSQPHRLHRFEHDEIGLVIVDEADACINANLSWSSILDWFPGAKVLGGTATWQRHDGRSLAGIFESVAFVYTLADGIRDGWLVPLYHRYVHVTGYRYGDVEVGVNECGEPDVNLPRTMHDETALQGVAHQAVHYSNLKTRWGSGRQTLIFTDGVWSAERLAEILNRRNERDGTGAATWIAGEMSTEERRQAVELYRERHVRYMVNCGVLVRGFDDGGTRIVLNACRGQSLPQIEQKIGRGTRPDESCVDALNRAMSADERKAIIHASVKPSCLILDPIGDVCRYKFKTVLDVLAGSADPKIVDRAGANMRERKTPKPVDEELALAREELEAEAKYARRGIIVDARWSSRAVDLNNEHDVPVLRGKVPSKADVPSIKVRRRLKSQGYSDREIDGMTGKGAGWLMRECLRRRKENLPSLKMEATLKKYGYELLEKVDGKDKPISRDRAKELIDALAANGWRKPESRPGEQP